MPYLLYRTLSPGPQSLKLSSGRMKGPELPDLSVPARQLLLISNSYDLRKLLLSVPAKGRGQAPLNRSTLNEGNGAGFNRRLATIYHYCTLTFQVPYCNHSLLFVLTRHVNQEESPALLPAARLIETTGKRYAVHSRS